MTHGQRLVHDWQEANYTRPVADSPDMRNLAARIDSFLMQKINEALGNFREYVSPPNPLPSMMSDAGVVPDSRPVRASDKVYWAIRIREPNHDDREASILSALVGDLEAAIDDAWNVLHSSAILLTRVSEAISALSRVKKRASDADIQRKETSP